ncbi:MAG: hypothetical protein NZM44_07305, partial [Candidatus Calescibacterium sp.]|nr:hypothetical protein [Candidatus Calescibacterium sp.]
QPNMAIIEDAHYGNSSNLIRICKLHKIKVAEFQHGYIGKNHLAYNWNESIKPFVKDFLPDYMLFWGKYWADNCNIPGIKKEIGFPYIIKKKKSLEETEKSILILIISSGSIPEEYIKLAKFIKSKIKNDRLFFRPHPVERKFVNQIYTEIINDGWIIDENNLHETLSKTIFCVSLEMTTVLFEALLFCSQVILIKSKASEIYIDNNLPFTIVNDFEELNEKLSKKDKININPCSYNDIFSENYENNFINFVNENVNNN